jgi:hypothetical protein
VKEFWKSFNIKHAIDIIAEERTEVPQSSKTEHGKNCFLVLFMIFKTLSWATKYKKIATAMCCTG